MSEESTTPDLVELVRAWIDPANMRRSPPGARQVALAMWVEGLIRRIDNHAVVDEGLAAAERLAESRR